MSCAGRRAGGRRPAVEGLPVVLVNVTGGGAHAAPTRSRTAEAAPRPARLGGPTDARNSTRSPTTSGSPKQLWGAFHGTGPARLPTRNMGDAGGVGGMATSIGVESTARAASNTATTSCLVTDAMTDGNARPTRTASPEFSPAPARPRRPMRSSRCWRQRSFGDGRRARPDKASRSRPIAVVRRRDGAPPVGLPAAAPQRLTISLIAAILSSVCPGGRAADRAPDRQRA